MEKTCTGRRVTRLPELPWGTQHVKNFFTTLGEPFTREKKNKLARIEGGPRLAGSSFFDGKVTLRARPTFLHMNTPTIRAYASAVGSSQLGQKD